jgi:hypothetical protein
MTKRSRRKIYERKELEKRFDRKH